MQCSQLVKYVLFLYCHVLKHYYLGMKYSGQNSIKFGILTAGELCPIGILPCAETVLYSIMKQYYSPGQHSIQFGNEYSVLFLYCHVLKQYYLGIKYSGQNSIKFGNEYSELIKYVLLVYCHMLKPYYLGMKYSCRNTTKLGNKYSAG